MSTGAGPRPSSLFEGYAFDLDGTVYLGDAALPGAVETLAAIREAGRAVVFVTNKPLESAEDYAAKLTSLGIPAARRDVVTATDSLVEYLSGTGGSARLLVVGEPLVHRVLASAGFALTSDPSEADVVVVTFDRTFDYAKLEAAYRAVRLHGARLVASNPDPFCPTPEGGLPDCAAMLAAIEACTGARAEAVTGKPSRQMADAVLSRLGVPASQTLLVGDRLATDVAMAKRSGMRAALVLSGATSSGDLDAAAPGARPDFVLEDLSELIPPARGPARATRRTARSSAAETGAAGGGAGTGRGRDGERTAEEERRRADG